MFGGPEGAVILLLVLVLFGGSQLPKLARNLGQAQKEFRVGMEEANQPTKTDAPDSASPSTSPAASPVPDPSGTD